MSDGDSASKRRRTPSSSSRSRLARCAVVVQGVLERLASARPRVRSRAAGVRRRDARGHRVELLRGRLVRPCRSVRPRGARRSELLDLVAAQRARARAPRLASLVARHPSAAARPALRSCSKRSSLPSSSASRERRLRSASSRSLAVLRSVAASASLAARAPPRPPARPPARRPARTAPRPTALSSVISSTCAVAARWNSSSARSRASRARGPLASGVARRRAAAAVHRRPRAPSSERTARAIAAAACPRARRAARPDPASRPRGGRCARRARPARLSRSSSARASPPPTFAPLPRGAPRCGAPAPARSRRAAAARGRPRARSAARARRLPPPPAAAPPPPRAPPPRPAARASRRPRRAPPPARPRRPRARPRRRAQARREPLGHRRHLLRRPAGQIHDRLVGFRERPPQLGHLGVERGAILGGAPQPRPQLLDLLALHARDPRRSRRAPPRPWRRRDRPASSGARTAAAPARSRARARLRPRDRHVERRRLGASFTRRESMRSPSTAPSNSTMPMPDKRRHAEHLHEREVRRHRAVKVVVAHATGRPGALGVARPPPPGALRPRAAPRSAATAPGRRDQRLALGNHHHVEAIVER